MKYAAIALAALVVICAALGIYTLANARITVADISINAVYASERESDFLTLQTAMDQNALAGTPFAASLPGSSSDYSLFTYTLRLKNKGLIDAEMVEVQPVPVNGDVLCYSSLNSNEANANVTVAAGKERDVWCVLLTSRQNHENYLTGRTFRITYYIWGMPKSTTVTFK